MTVGDIMKALITAEDYNRVRVCVADQFLVMAKGMLPDYEYIKEKEEKYQELVKSFKHENTHSSKE